MDRLGLTSRQGCRVLQREVDQDSVAAAVLKPHSASRSSPLSLLSRRLLGAKRLWETTVSPLGSSIPFVFFAGRVDNVAVCSTLTWRH